MLDTLKTAFGFGEKGSDVVLAPIEGEAVAISEGEGRRFVVRV